MENNKRLKKVCPKCNVTLHVRRSVCGCGYSFSLKRKAQLVEKLELMKRRRALETEHDVLTRKEQNKIRTTSMKASEIREQTLLR